jgi:Uma2 family endonuclease
MTALTVNLKPFVETDDEFFELCLANPDLRLERTATGEVIIMAPAGSETGARNLSISGQLWAWNERYRLGEAFDSSTGFKLPNGADRSPDASWIVQERWDALTREQKQKFAPICPDFVVELRSPSDSLETVREKIKEYMANGAQLGWLIDPNTRQVEVYHPCQEVEILDNPKTVSGDPLLPGFTLDLAGIFRDF